MSKDNKNVNIIDELFLELKTANGKAKAASLNYNKLLEEITEVERQRATNTNRITSPTIAKQLKDNRLENDKELASYYSSYTFWTSEVTRISALLQGTLAVKHLKRLVMGETVSPPSIYPHR